MSRSQMPEETRLALDEAVRDLEQIGLSGVSKLVARTVLVSLRARRERTDVLAHVQRLDSELSGIAEVLARCTARLQAAELAEAAREPDGEAEWAQRKREVTAAFEALEEGAGGVWLRAWLVALERGDRSRCDEIATIRGRPERLRDTASAMQRVAQALDEADPAAALAPLGEIVDGGEAGPDSLVRLDLLRVRILLREFSDRVLVRAVAGRALDRAMGTPEEALARAALAEVQLANEGPEDAEATLLPAVSAVSATGSGCDALVLLGEVAEARGAWVEADGRYDEALDVDPRAAWPVLLRRVPARLLVRAATRPGVDAATAVDLLDRALALGVPGDGDFPDADVWVSKGDHLLELARAGAVTEGVAEVAHAAPEDEVGDAGHPDGSRRAAAEAYFQGGLRYSLSSYFPRALELFGVACDLAPEEPVYRWERAEALRLSAYGPNDAIDRDRLLRARGLLGEGAALRPSPDQAWVLVTQSKVEEGLGEPGSDPVLPLERALLLRPDFEYGHAFLAAALRRQGWVSEAEEAIRQDPTDIAAADAFSFSTRLELCVDRADHAEALGLLDERALFTPADDQTTLQRAEILLRAGDARRAVDTLVGNGAETGGIYRGLAMATLGLDDPEWAGLAREEFYALWLETRSGSREDVAGYAAFRAGLVDEGIRTYERLVASAPADLAYGRDLGQMLLTRGDVDRGLAVISEGIDRCPFASDLDFLERIELPLVRRAVSGRPAAAEVLPALDAVAQRAAARRAELLSRRRPPGPVVVTAATARTALHRGSALDALGLYLGLVGEEGLPEAGAGAALAAEAGVAAADDRFVEGDRDAARQGWDAVVSAVAALPEGEAAVHSVQARRAVADLLDPPHGGPSPWRDPGLDFGTEAARAELARAADALVGGPEDLWDLRDGLLRLADDYIGIPPTARDAAEGLAADLPVSRVYALDSGDAVTYPSFLSVRQLEMRVGTGVSDALGDSLDALVGDVVNRVDATVGVRIPWVYHDVDRRLDAAQVDFDVYGRWVRSVRLPEDPTARRSRLADELERTVRGQLYRLVGVDDIALWLEGWDLEHRDAPDWRPTDPAVDRLRLARLLRMLLREGASVADRVRVLSGLDAAGGEDRARDSATLDTLRDVRRRLGRDALGVLPGAEVAQVPADLEARLQRGLTGDRPAWELARPDALAVVNDLRSWLESERSPGTVVVRDARLRPFLWRLLGDRQVVVLSEEEMGHE